MKRLLLFLPIIFWGCEQLNQNVNPENSSIVDTSVTVSNDLVNLIALNHFYELHPKYDYSKGAKSTLKSFSQFDSTFVIKDKKGRNAINFFKYKNDNGWNIIAGDNRFHPILAYNTHGEADLDTSRNPGLKYWIDDILQQIEFMDNNGIKQSDRVKYQWGKYIKSSGEINMSKNEPPEDPGCPPSLEAWAVWNSSTNEWEGLTGLNWNQTAGFNYYMPIDNCEPLSSYCNKYPAGCGPVAIGMLMNYYQRPVSFTFNGSPRTINYNLMPTDISINCNPPTADKEEVAALLYYVAGKYASPWCFEIGVPFYYSSKSATALYPNNIRQTFSDWAYSSPGNKIDYSSNYLRLIENLKLRRPVIFSGSSCDVCLWNAHIWLCEGLKEYHDELCSTWIWVYMNWGYGGMENGWYGISNSYTLYNTTFNNANMKIVVDINP